MCCYIYLFYLQLCDACLAPNTEGDGTGCDNMTVVVVVFKYGQFGVGDNKQQQKNLTNNEDVQQKKSTTNGGCNETATNGGN
jgi:hypothetical protein